MEEAGVELRGTVQCTHARGNVEETMSYLRTLACAKIRQDAINAPPIDVD